MKETVRALLQRLPGKRDLARIALPVVALGLIASVVVGREKPSEAPQEPVARMNTRIAPAEKPLSDADLDPARLVRPALEEGKVTADANPFSRRSFEPPQAAAGAAAGAPEAPAPPEAPPLPFTYLGKVIEDGKLSVFLARGEDSYSITAGQKRGQKIGNEYRVDKVTESSVSFTYLPMNTKQTLDIPAVN